jgi:transposase
MNEKNRQTYYGALNLCEPDLIISEYKKGDGEYTVDFVNKLIQKNPTQKILIFWDGAAYHQGKLMQEFLSKTNTGLEKKDWQVTCHLFAPYAPEENPIESVWLQVKSACQALLSFLQEFSNH